MAGSWYATGEKSVSNVTKLANQVVWRWILRCQSVLAAKRALTDLVYQAIRGGLAGSTVLDASADGDGQQTRRIDLHIKDLANAGYFTASARNCHSCSYGMVSTALRIVWTADHNAPWRATTKNWRKSELLMTSCPDIAIRAWNQTE